MYLILIDDESPFNAKPFGVQCGYFTDDIEVVRHYQDNHGRKAYRLTGLVEIKEVQAEFKEITEEMT